MVLLFKTRILKVMPKLYYFPKRWFWMYFRNGITFQNADSESNSTTVLRLKKYVSQSHSKMVFLLKQCSWKWYQNCNSKMALLFKEGLCMYISYTYIYIYTYLSLSLSIYNIYLLSKTLVLKVIPRWYDFSECCFRQ